MSKDKVDEEDDRANGTRFGSSEEDIKNQQVIEKDPSRFKSASELEEAKKKQ